MESKALLEVRKWATLTSGPLGNFLLNEYSILESTIPSDNNASIVEESQPKRLAACDNGLRKRECSSKIVQKWPFPYLAYAIDLKGCYR
jgi:hypothetical protein